MTVLLSKGKFKPRLSTNLTFLQELEAMKGENEPENKARPGTAPAAGTDKWLENKKTQKKVFHLARAWVNM